SRPASSSPSRATSSHSAAPLSSSPSPLAFDVLTVITAARATRSRSQATRSALRARGGRRGTPVGAAPAALLQQDALLDLDSPLQALDHVIHGQRCHRAGRHRLHLHARAGDRAYLAGELDEALIDLDAR